LGAPTIDATPYAAGLAQICEALADAYGDGARPAPGRARDVARDLEWRARQQAFEAALPGACPECTKEQQVVWFTLRALAAAHIAGSVAVPVYAEVGEDVSGTPLARVVTNFEACGAVQTTNADTEIWQRFCAQQLEEWQPRYAAFRDRSKEGDAPGGPDWCWEATSPNVRSINPSVPGTRLTDRIIVGFFTPEPAEENLRAERHAFKRATLERLRRDQALPVVDGDAELRRIEEDANWAGNHCASPLEGIGKLEWRYDAATIVPIESPSDGSAPTQRRTSFPAPRSASRDDRAPALPSRRDLRYGTVQDGIRVRVLPMPLTMAESIRSDSPDKQASAALARCYAQTQLATTRDVVSYRATVTIGSRGNVSSVKLHEEANAQSALGRCMNEALSKLAFTCPQGGYRELSIAACAFRDGTSPD